MNLQGKRILLTGAAGGIGRELARELAQRGARLCLVGRTDASMASLRHLIDRNSMDAVVAQADLTDAHARERVLQLMQSTCNGLDVLINLAGLMDFQLFGASDPAMIPRMLQINLLVPMQLTREVLPGMLAQGSGRIVNIGSMFGSIGYPGFATYSASKFALRGFSQALRRELSDTGIGVTYVSPRAVRTPFNPHAVHAMAAEGMMHMDEPVWVATRIVRAIEQERNEAYLGFPESFFARLNGLWPGVVDRSLRKVVPAVARFARGLS
ncbi:SDR family oxidoreductase [Rhodanobacter ginsengisoli]|uniref:SDR family oxidoreductase n=1 Tax=Rhodanobacter ginsengisoli TaxID=418646 RepID=A0ABW0QSD7_9GAMM